VKRYAGLNSNIKKVRIKSLTDNNSRYECMNDIGVNVAQVLDDLQCGYMNNDEYIRMSRVEEYINSPKQGKIDLTKVTRDQGTDSQGFDTIWGNGIKMNWTLVPVEEQKPHIGWRQAIDDDGSKLGRLASWMDPNSGMTAAITNALNNEKKTNIYLENQKAMDANQGNEAYSEYIKAGRELAEGTIDQARTDYENNKSSIKDAIGNGNDIDILAVLAASVARGTTDYKAIVEEYRQVSTNIGSSNPALIWTAMGTSSTIVKRYVDGTLEAYVNQGNQSSVSGGNGQSTSTTSAPPVTLIPEPKIVEHDWGIQRETNSNVSVIAIHHAGEDWTVERVDTEYRTGKHGGITGGIGYHFYIHKDGTIHRGNPENMIGAHVQGHDNGSIGISHQGDFSSTDPTDEQWQSLISLVAYLCKRYSITPSRSTIKGHREFSGHESNDCPGDRLFAKLDELVQSVADNKMPGAANKLWVDFVELIKKGIEKEGKASVNGLDLFPKICYLYVKLMNDVTNSSFDSDQGWVFPYSEDVINSTPEKCVFLTGKYREQRETHLHEGIDIQPSGLAGNPETDIPFCAIKGGTVYTQGQWCNAIYIAHDDGTWSRYLHCRSHMVSHGDIVTKGQQIGITGGSDGSSETYAVHLHLEIGKQIPGKTSQERTVGDDCGINPLDCFRQPNQTIGGYQAWAL